MKKSVKFTFMMAVVLVVSVLAGTAAFASDYDAQANTLNELGLFQGTNNGYELDRSSTRAEAAVMLVRMLGKEAEVKVSSYTDPFTDVDDWAENYIGYMYEYGLTNGTSATTFGADEKCTAQMFTAFVLRALGYSEENGDFTYAQAQDFASEIGLASTADASGPFLRDNMAALSYSALFLDIKDSDKTLLEKLVSENAVDASAAKKCLDYYDVYQSYLADSAKANQSTSMRMSSDSEISITMGDVVQNIFQTTDSAVVLKNNDFIMKQSTVIDYAGTTTETTSYYSNGWLYTETPEGKYKYEYPIDFTTMIEEAGMSQSIEPFYLIDSIQKTKTANGVSYSIAYSVSAMNKILGSQLSQLTAIISGMDMQYKSLEITVEFDTDGNTTGMTLSGSLNLVMTVEGQENSMDMVIEIVSYILETGDSVTVTLPTDLDDYIELELAQS